jgi:AcrR family transcriptional regulator
MKRAQNPDQKDQRRKNILETARAIIARREYRSIKLQDVADELGLVKGTLYRYFPTKQDLFMELYREDLTDWLDEWAAIAPDWCAEKATKPKKGEPKKTGTKKDAQPASAELAKRITTTLAHRPGLARMIGGFHFEIEPDLSEQGLIEFKRFLRDFIAEAGTRIERLAPEFAGRGFRTALEIYVLIQGSASLAYPSERIRAVVSETPDLAAFKVDFEKLFRPLLERLLAGEPAQKPRAKTV